MACVTSVRATRVIWHSLVFLAAFSSLPQKAYIYLEFRCDGAVLFQQFHSWIVSQFVPQFSSVHYKHKQHGNYWQQGVYDKSAGLKDLNKVSVERIGWDKGHSTLCIVGRWGGGALIIPITLLASFAQASEKKKTSLLNDFLVFGMWYSCSASG